MRVLTSGENETLFWIGMNPRTTRWNRAFSKMEVAPSFVGFAGRFVACLLV